MLRPLWFYMDLFRMLMPFLPKVLANLLALAGVCPFVGSLSDLVGRRYVAIIGAFLVCIGMIVSSTANTMNTFICMTHWNDIIRSC